MYEERMTNGVFLGEHVCEMNWSYILLCKSALSTTSNANFGRSAAVCSIGIMENCIQVLNTVWKM